MFSQLPRFYQLSLEERQQRIAQLAQLAEEELLALEGSGGLTSHDADRMIENALGVMGIPLGVCVHLQINGADVLVPMAIEEPSVLAAASHAAKLLRAGGGISARASDSLMIGQIQILDLDDPNEAVQTINNNREEILSRATQVDPALIEAGGGPRDLEVRLLPPIEPDDPCPTMLIVHLIVDVRDAMGANAINTICETLAPFLEQLTGGRCRLRILSNLADRRLVSVQGRVPFAALSRPTRRDQPGVEGKDAARGIEEASVFAERDSYRAATHNKGIMNGIDAVLLATGQDFRAVEAGAHAYAARKGRYTALSRWRIKDGQLEGELTLPLAVGVVGGITRVHPTARAALRIMGVQHAHQLAKIAAAVGLAQNLAAIRALALEGIQQGHMRLHARNIAVEAGAAPDEIAPLTEAMVQQNKINSSLARELLETLRQQKK